MGELKSRVEGMEIGGGDLALRKQGRGRQG